MNKEKLRRWLTIAVFSVLVFAVVFLYKNIVTERYFSYYTDLLLIFNKSLAVTGFLLIALSLAMGPLARYFPKLAPKVRLRKEIGISGFLFAALHAFVTKFFLYEDIFTKTWRDGHSQGMNSAKVALVIFTIAFVTSYKPLATWLGYKKWVYIQRLSYIGLLLSVVHIIAIRKMPSLSLTESLSYAKNKTEIVVFIVILIAVFALRISVIRKKKAAKKPQVSPAKS